MLDVNNSISEHTNILYIQIFSAKKLRQNPNFFEIYLESYNTAAASKILRNCIP